MLGRKDFAAAEDHFGRALKIAPDQPDVLYNLALTLVDRKNYVEAETICRKSLQVRPGDAGVESFLGTAFDGQARHVDAVAAYRRAIALNSRHALPYNRRGMSLAKLDRLAEAALRRAVQLAPNCCEAQDNLRNIIRLRRKNP